MIGLGSDKKKKLGPLDKKIEMTCLAIDQYQPGIFYLQNYELQRNTHFFLGLECFYRHPNSKMSNHKLKYISFLLLGILDSNTKMGNETAGYFASTLKL